MRKFLIRWWLTPNWEKERREKFFSEGERFRWTERLAQLRRAGISPEDLFPNV